MNKHFFRGVLLVVAVATGHFAIQAIVQPPPGISNALSLITWLGLGAAGIILWRKHHPWAGGFLTTLITLYILPFLYILLLILTGGTLM